jgi:hypothetical protein
LAKDNSGSENFSTIEDKSSLKIENNTKSQARFKKNPHWLTAEKLQSIKELKKNLKAAREK